RVVTDFSDNDARVDLRFKLVGYFLAHRLDHHAEIGAMNDAVLLQLPTDPLGVIDGNGKADTLITARIGRDGRIDADHLAVEIHEWAAAIARVNRRVGLNKILAATFAEYADAAALRADDAGGHSAFQSKGLTQRQHPIAYFYFIAPAQPCYGQ